MDTKNDIYKSRTEDRKTINLPEPITYYEPTSKLEKWAVAIACATFFPLIYLIGRTIKYLLN